MADYQSVLKGKYPGKLHAKRVVDYIREKNPNASGVLYLESKSSKLLEDSDMDENFRQRRYFFYLTGVDVPDCQFIHDMSTSTSTLFIPPVDPESVIWSGLPLSAQEALEKYDVDEVKYTTDLNPTLARIGTVHKKTASGSDSTATQSTVYAVPGQVSDFVTFLEFDTTIMSVLKEAIDNCRVIKTDYEIALIRKANAISSAAHVAAMKSVKGRKAINETQIEAVFHEKCMWEGAKKQAYQSIIASGRAASTLHYVRNDQPLEKKENVLLDAGCEWMCYAADITRTFPLSGKFSKESRAIYDIVLRMQQESVKSLKAGVVWDDVHANAHRIAIEGLTKLGILKGDKDEIFESKVSVAFFPHGLGHYMGMEVHDTGGNADYKDKNSMFRYLRVRGKLPAGAVITVEPGVYFCNYIIDPCLIDPVMSKYIDKDVLERYWDVGGVRIEDDVLITETGYENLTTVTSDADEIEAIVSKG